MSVLQGSSGGLTASGGQLFTQVGGAIEAGDRFGAALAAGDFSNNGFADLAVGALVRLLAVLEVLVRSACCRARPAA